MEGEKEREGERERGKGEEITNVVKADMILINMFFNVLQRLGTIIHVCSVRVHVCARVCLW